MYTVLVIFHVLACLALILIVLLQTGKGAEMGAAFGGASQTLFGGSGGTTFLGKLTTGAAVVFMVTCLGLTYFSIGPQTKSIMEDVKVEKPEGPVLPEAKPVESLPPVPMPGPTSSATSEGGNADSGAVSPQATAPVEEKAPASVSDESEATKATGQ